MEKKMSKFEEFEQDMSHRISSSKSYVEVRELLHEYKAMAARLKVQPKKATAYNYGQKVMIQFVSGTKLVLRNVTEIHYNYESPAKEIMGAQCAFESDVHTTGATYAVVDIKEFETRVESTKQDQFDEEGVVT